jgi:hypothetical protein
MGSSVLVGAVAIGEPDPLFEGPGEDDLRGSGACCVGTMSVVAAAVERNVNGDGPRGTDLVATADDSGTNDGGGAGEGAPEGEGDRDSDGEREPEREPEGSGDPDGRDEEDSDGTGEGDALA